MNQNVGNILQTQKPNTAIRLVKRDLTRFKPKLLKYM